jgi:hypothetical protein
MMRKLWAFLILLTLTGAATCVQGQSALKIKAGIFNPRDAKAGFIVGIATGRQVDERVDFGIGADLFIRRFEQEEEVDTNTSTSQTDPEIYQTELSYSMYGLPIMVHLDVRILPDAPVIPYVGIAGGYELLFSREANYLEDDTDNRLYGGFGWQLLAGAEYPIGSASSILGEIMYNGSKLSRSQGSSAAGLPLHEELDFSGFGFRLGFRLGG